jgi:hypothetical protein
MNTLILALRLIHISGGVFWVGTTLLFDLFIIPSIRTNAEVGPKFLGTLIKSHLGEAHGLSGILSGLAGASLYWIDSMGFSSAWTVSSAGLGFGIGAIFGFAGLITGVVGSLPLRALAETAAQIQGNPSAEQINKMQAAQARLAATSRIEIVVLLISLICMATARYWRF